MNKQKLYKELETFYGSKAQCLICIEEMAELTKELVKYERGFQNHEQIAEELADVEITLEQVKAIYGINKEVEEWKSKKLKRTAERLEQDRKKL